MICKYEYLDRNGKYVERINIPDYIKLELSSVIKPSIVFYRSNKICYEEYYKNGKKHREDGPAYVEYYDCNGKIKFEMFYDNDLSHSSVGPQTIMYDIYGKIVFKGYVLFGKEFSQEDFQFLLNNDMTNIIEEEWPEDFKIMWELRK